MAESCQQVILPAWVSLTLSDFTPEHRCDKPASLYRQCAAGCKIVIAYCEEHGGDERAVREMVLHHSIVHNQGPDGNHT